MTYYVLRGGSWCLFGYKMCRSAFRNFNFSNGAIGALSFRLAFPQ